MKTREEAFAPCEQLFREMHSSTDASYVALKKDAIAAELMRLYKPYFLHLPTLQHWIASADRDGRRSSFIPFDTAEDQPNEVDEEEKDASEYEKADEEKQADSNDTEDSYEADETDESREKRYWRESDQETRAGYLSSESYECYLDAVIHVLKNYDPEKGNLYSFLFWTFKHRLQTNARSFYSQQLYVDVTKSSVEIYAEPDPNSNVLRTLTPSNTRKNVSFKVYDIRMTGGLSWYKIKHQFMGETVEGYIPSSADVWLVDTSSFESTDWQNEDGDTEERPDLVSEPRTDESTLFWQNENRFTRLNSIWIMSLMQNWLNEAEHSETGNSGKFTQYISYRMLYTEYIVMTLHEFDAVRTDAREAKCINNTDQEWMDYFMEKRCRSFRDIIGTRRHTYAYFSLNSSSDEIRLPAEIGIRAPFLQMHRDINREVHSIEQSFSRHKKKYDEMLRLYLERKGVQFTGGGNDSGRPETDNSESV